MDAYLVPVLATMGAAAFAAVVLGAVRAHRWWASLRGHPPDASWAPGPGVPGDVADPLLPRLAHRTLAAALLIAFTAVFFVVEPRTAGSGAVDFPTAAAALSLLAAWAATWSGR